jgi:hypothetical protein
MAAHDSLERTLGWLSIALGIMAVLQPKKTAEMAGISADETAVRSALGARELACGTGILKSETPTPWLWARVAGDTVDLTVLAGALGAGNGKHQRTMYALAAIACITALDLVASVRAAARGKL